MNNKVSKTIKPIETQYNGYLFRSRTEARWAVLFDELGVKYEYEFEGFDLGKEGWYLPDFWLPETKGMTSRMGFWVEIKPTHLTEKEIKRCEELARQSNHDCVSFEGTPSTMNTNCVCYVNANFINKFTDELEVLTFDTHPLCYYMKCSIPRLSKAVNAAKSARFKHHWR